MQCFSITDALYNRSKKLITKIWGAAVQAASVRPRNIEGVSCKPNSTQNKDEFTPFNTTKNILPSLRVSDLLANSPLL